jgi:hypothetical protein
MHALQGESVHVQELLLPPLAKQLLLLLLLLRLRRWQSNRGSSCPLLLQKDGLQGEIG